MHTSHSVRLSWILGALLLMAGAGLTSAQTSLPSDVAMTCPVSEEMFRDWFFGSVVKNGSVKAADSVNFPKQNTTCMFYQWGAQMFLWLTSPVDDGLVLDGPAFFTVLPPNAQGKRLLVSNDESRTLKVALRSGKPDTVGEIGQAGGGGVLMSQGESLVYYGLHVNNIFAYFLTGQKEDFFAMTKYPYNDRQLKAVEVYTGARFEDVFLYSPKALVMELKTSWVKASTLKNPEDFIRIKGEIPTYKPAQGKETTLWKRQQATEVTELALVGLHIVGTVQNHPEFVWATFEHLSNVPDASYWYNTAGGKSKTFAFSSKGTYTFAQSGVSVQEANTKCMKENRDGDIVAVEKSGTLACANGISPSSTVRVNPWGSPGEKASAENNTLLISNNRSVINQLPEGDVRKNYIQVGGTWTAGRTDGDLAPIPDTDGYKESVNLRGSPLLANSTMETYTQDLNCFDCHFQSAKAPDSFKVVDYSALSHIYEEIVPLIPDDSERQKQEAAPRNE